MCEKLLIYGCSSVWGLVGWAVYLVAATFVVYHWLKNL